MNECNILRKLDHPNIVNIIEIWEWNKLFFIVTDYYAGGELNDFVSKRGYLEEFEVFKFMKDFFFERKIKGYE